MRASLRPGLIALAATISLLTSAGLSASAQAALGAPCSGNSIEGHGSVSQRAAQDVWTLLDPYLNLSFNTDMNYGCTLPGPAVRYTRTNSSTCLSAFGANNGALTTTTWAFCGTDSPPTTAQITTINSATKAKVLTIPVAQFAITVVVNPPSGCTISTVTPTQLEQTFRGSIATWSGLSSSGSCGNPINRVVPNDSVGTTYPFKHYLATINSAVVHNGSTWSELQSTSTSATWPNPTTVTKSQSGCATVMSLQCPGGLNSGTTGDDDEVRTVGATSGSIGFGALGSARAVYATTTHTNFKWIGIHSAFGGTINPSTNGLSATTGRSNCNETVGAYSPLPAAGATGTWSTTYMTNPGSTYPLCALTWDLALTQYAPHWGPTGASTARTAHDYLQYVLRTGQAVASFLTHDYALTANLTEVGTTGVQEITG